MLELARTPGPDPKLPTRRRALAAMAALAAQAAGGASIGLGLPGLAAAQAPLPTLRVTQLIDGSASELELSRDYATGVRLALTELGRTGATQLRLSTVTVNGSAASLEGALRAVKDDPSQVALLGTAGERLALASIDAARQIGLDIAHLAPWLADTRHDAGHQVFPLFASRETQIERALRSLASAGFGRLGLVYASPALQQAMHDGIAQAAARLGVATQSFTATGAQDMAAYGAQFAATSPVVLLFVGGTVELALFSQGLDQRRLQRYVICLADVDVATLMQLGTGRSASLILTQVVPNPQSNSVPLVRRYRSALKDLYDEAPSQLSLAGYVAGRYAAQALSVLRGKPGRADVLAELQRRQVVDLSGFNIRFTDGRGSNFVNQTLLQRDGKLIG